MKGRGVEVGDVDEQALRLLWLSVTTPEPGLGNYTALVADDVTTTIVLRTLLMAAVVTVVCVVVAYPYAYLMTIVSGRWRGVLLAVVLVPFWTSLMARTFAWVVLLQDNGVVNQVLGAVGLGPVRLLGTTAGVTLAMAQVMLPFVVLPVYTAMRGIDRRLVDAALSLGARPVTAFARVYLPLSLPAVAAGATLVMVLSLGFYVTPVLLSLTMFIQQRLTPNTATDPAQQKMMQFMPLIFGAFMISLPAGLTLYMLTNAVASIVQQLILNKKLGISHATAVPSVVK